MGVPKIIRQYPFTSYAAFVVLLSLAISAINSTNEGVSLLLGAAWVVLAFPFYLVSEMLFSLRLGLPHGLATLAIGATLCFAADAVLWRLRTPRAGAA